MIIIPMAGRSEDSFKMDIVYQCRPLHGKTLFEWSLLSFKNVRHGSLRFCCSQRVIQNILFGLCEIQHSFF